MKTNDIMRLRLDLGSYNFQMRFCTFATTVFALILYTALPGMASTITVTSLADDGSPGTLRYAIVNANSGDTINFAKQVSGTITLTQGQLEINKNVTISGPGASSMAISGNNSVEVFAISQGITATISGVTIANGSAANGGGVYNNGGTLTLSDCTLSGNQASGYGGGIFNNKGMLTLTNCTLAGNAAVRGGGIWNGNSSTLNVTNSTLSGNTASEIGGGIWNTSLPGGTTSQTGSTLNLTNSTLAGNSAGAGGGIYNGASTLNLTNSTLSGNSAVSAVAGGINNDIGALVVKNTILANPTGGNCFFNTGSTSTSQGHNLSDDTSCSSFFTGTGDLNNTSAQLDPNGLQNNGSTTTQTIALLRTSPAVNAVPLSPTNYCTALDGTTPVATDQRGVSRPQDWACDIGAFELQADVDNGLAVLNGSNTFTGNQAVNGTLTATSLTGSAAGLTNLPAANLTGTISDGNLPGDVARLGLANMFTSPQNITVNSAGGALTANNPGGNYGVAGTGGSAGVVGVTGSVSPTAAAGVFNNQAAGNAGNILLGQSNFVTKFSVDGKGDVAASGSVAIGGGTAITEHLSLTFNPSFPPLKPGICSSANFTFTGASDGDTIALGVSNAMMTVAGIPNYFGWVSAANAVTIRACNLDPNVNQKTGASGTIRVDVWKH